MENVIDRNSTSEEALRQAVFAYFQIMDQMQDEVLILYQELKALPKEDQEYVMQKEREMVGILERVISNSYANVLDEKNVKLVANNVYVQGQMWGFRRWLIQKGVYASRIYGNAVSITEEPIGFSSELI